MASMSRMVSKKKLPSNFGELGYIRDTRDHHNNQQRTSWTDLREISFKRNEEHDLKVMLGIPLPKFNGREGLGGGGNSVLRKEISLGKLESKLVSSGQKLAQNGRQRLSPSQPYLSPEKPSAAAGYHIQAPGPNNYSTGPPALKQSHSVTH